MVSHGVPTHYLLVSCGRHRTSLARGVDYPWGMARTLFDVDDAPEATPAAATPCVRTPPRLRREAIVPVRLTEGERDRLAEVARDLGISVSTYIRQAVLSRPLPPRRAVRPIPEVNRETYQGLAQLAADVNVIARRMAERRREPGSTEVLEALELVTRFLGTVRAEVLGTSLAPEENES